MLLPHHPVHGKGSQYVSIKQYSGSPTPRMLTKESGSVTKRLYIGALI